MKNRMPLLSVVGVVAGMSAPTVLRAQPDTLEIFFEQQSSIAEGIVNELGATSVERRLFSLRTANLMLSSATTPSSFAFEDAVEAGALPVLAELARDPTPEVAELARNVRARIVEELGLERRANPLQILDGAATQTLTNDEYDGWLAFAAQGGMQYRFRASGCDVVRALALRAGEQTPLAGGVVVNRGFVFDPEASGNVEMRIRTSRCTGSGDMSIASGSPMVEIPASTSADSPFHLTVGNVYAGGLSGEQSHWFSVSTTSSQALIIEVTPLTEDLDATIAVWDSSGAELAYHDDYGANAGERAEIATPPNGELTIEVSSFYSASKGEYELSVTSLPPPIERARPVNLSQVYPSELVTGETEWWRFDPQSGTRYRAETTLPDELPDTILSVMQSDGMTLIGENDDRGVDLGSRVDFHAASAAPLLFKVYSINGTGRYDFSVTPYSLELANDGVAVSEGRYQGSLNDDGEIWWKLDSRAGRYEVEVVPSEGLDTMIELYDSEGIALLESDDDSGSNFGSRLAFSTPEDDFRMLRVRSFDGSPGDFEIVLTRLPSLGEIAEEATPNETYSAEVALNGDRWWTLEVREGRSYVIEATPVGLFDSVITIYSDAGSTVVGSDDDSGGNGGSLLSYVATYDGPLFIQVTGFDGASGAFELSIGEQQ